MITKIGVAAGDIWNYLDSHDRVASMDDLIRGLQLDRDLILMSIGWLAREGHVVLEGEGPDCKVELKEQGGRK